MKKILAALALLIIARPALAATTFYTNQATGSDGRSCTTVQNSATPKATILSGLGCLTPGAGDTLIIANATYEERIWDHIPSGSAGNPTIVKAANANLAKIQPKQTTLANGVPGQNYYGIWIASDGASHSYITIDGILVSMIDQPPLGGIGQAGTACRIGSDNVASVVHDIVFKNGSCNDVKGGEDDFDIVGMGCGQFANAANAYNMTIDNMDFSGNDHYGLYVTCHDSVFKNSRFFNNGWLGIHQYCNGCEILNNNTYFNDIVHDNGTDTGACQSIGGWLMTSSTSGDLIYNSLVYNNGNHSRVCATDPWASMDAGPGFDIAPAGIMNGLKIYNTSTYNSAEEGIRLHAAASSNTIQNNITFGNDGGTIVSAGGNTINSNLLTDPSWTSPGTGDFTLQPGSSAIGAGLNLNTVFLTDIVGTVRGGTWDIGAYQGGGGAPLLPLVERFSYTLTSNLDGKNGGQSWDAAWTKGATGNITVETAAGCGNGSVARSNGTTGDTSYTRSFTPRGQGIISWYMSLSVNPPVGGDVGGVLTGGGLGAMSVEFDGNNIVIFENGFTLPVLVSGYVPSRCYFIEVELDQVGHPNEFRARANGATWSLWYTVIAGTFTPLDGFGIEDISTNAHTFYFDEINGADTSASMGTGLLTMGAGR